MEPEVFLNGKVVVDRVPATLQLTSLPDDQDFPRSRKATTRSASATWSTCMASRSRTKLGSRRRRISTFWRARPAATGSFCCDTPSPSEPGASRCRCPRPSRTSCERRSRWMARSACGSSGRRTETATSTFTRKSRAGPGPAPLVRRAAPHHRSGNRSQSCSRDRRQRPRLGRMAGIPQQQPGDPGRGTERRRVHAKRRLCLSRRAATGTRRSPPRPTARSRWRGIPTTRAITTCTSAGCTSMAKSAWTRPCPSPRARISKRAARSHSIPEPAMGGVRGLGYEMGQGFRRVRDQRRRALPESNLRVKCFGAGRRSPRRTISSTRFRARRRNFGWRTTGSSSRKC